MTQTVARLAPACNGTDPVRELTGQDYEVIASMVNARPDVTDAYIAEFLHMDEAVVAEGRRVLEEKGLSLFDERDPHGLEWAATTPGPTDGEIGRARFKQMLGAAQKGTMVLLAQELQAALSFGQRKQLLLNELADQCVALDETIYALEAAPDADEKELNRLRKQKTGLLKERIRLETARGMEVQDLVRILTVTSDNLRHERGETIGVADRFLGGRDPQAVSSLTEALLARRKAVEEGRLIPGNS